MRKRIIGLVTVFAVIIGISATSLANSSYSHSYSSHKETCSITVSGSDTYNAVVQTKVYNNNGTILDSDSASNTSLKSTTLSTSSYSTSATHGYWYAHCSNNQHSNEHFTYDGIDS